MKTKIKLLYYKIKALLLYFDDFKRHIRYSLQYIDKNEYGRDSLRCEIMLLNHQLEKAQTYKNQKTGYGEEKINLLLTLMNRYVLRYGYDDLIYTSLGVLHSHFENTYSYKDDVCREAFNHFLSEADSRRQVGLGGIILHDAIHASYTDELYDLLASRKSCRQYSEDIVEDSKIETAVKMAQLTPSACNRQSIRVHYYKDKKTIENIILSQKSDVDWCLNAKGLLIITSNEYYYRDYLERNQRMFDAGLFSMTLVLSLHSLGIGSCFKMIQKETKIERETKAIGGIPAMEDICVLLLIGKYPKERFVVAKSSRLGLDSILLKH